MEIIRFDNPYILYGLALLPLLIILHYLINRRKRKLLRAFADTELYARLAPKASGKRNNWKHALFITALAFLILALANPQIGSRMEKSTRKGVDLVIALDVSNSMLAEDINPNRLDNAKRAVDQLIQRLEGDRIGLVIFAGHAYKQLPITTDYSAARMFLRAISTDIVPTQGTAIGEAIEQSLSAFDEKSNHNKAIILISDGENHQGNALKAAEKAREKGVIVHSIGMGSLKGAPIPASANNASKRYKQDQNGNTVITQLNQTMLKDIARKGKGKYILANNANSGVNSLYDEIKKMEDKEFKSRVYADYEDRFQYPLAIAILLLIVEHLLFNRKSPLARKINIFEQPMK